MADDMLSEYYRKIRESKRPKLGDDGYVITPGPRLKEEEISSMLEKRKERNKERFKRKTSSVVNPPEQRSNDSQSTSGYSSGVHEQLVCGYAIFFFIQHLFIWGPRHF